MFFWHFPRNVETLERLGESGATHDSQSASRSGVEARVAWNLNGPGYSDAALSQGWVRCPSGLALAPAPHAFLLGHRTSCTFFRAIVVFAMTTMARSFTTHLLPNLFCGSSGSVRTGLTGVRSEPGPRTHLTSLLFSSCLLGKSWHSYGRKDGHASSGHAWLGKLK